MSKTITTTTHRYGSEMVVQNETSSKECVTYVTYVE